VVHKNVTVTFNDQFLITRDQLKVVFPLTAVTESGTISEQSVSAITETTWNSLLTYGRSRNRKWTYAQLPSIVNQTTT